ncbi:hypothetical protein GEMRC1_001269 [Eukaryota sp. GEM-RC1]
MKMQFRDFEGAMSSWKDTFQAFDEAGSSERLRALQFLVLTSLMSQSDVDIFSAPEVKPYQDAPEVRDFYMLFVACQNLDISGFEKALSRITDEEMFEFLEDLRFSIRSRVVLDLIPAFSKLPLDYLSRRLECSESEVISLLTRLIVYEKLNGYIDSKSNTLVLKLKDSADGKLVGIITEWSTSILSSVRVN